MEKIRVLLLVIFTFLTPFGFSQNFRAEFDQAVRLKDVKGMGKLVMKHPNEALGYGREILEKMVMGTASEEETTIFEALKKIFEKKLKSRILYHMEKFYKEGGEEAIKNFKALRAEYFTWANQINLFRQGNKEAWKKAYTGLWGLGEKFMQIGEYLYASHCYQNLWFLEDKNPNGKDLKKIYTILEKFVECRKKWDFRIDLDWARGLKFFEYLKAMKEQGKLDEIAKQEEKPKQEKKPGETKKELSGIPFDPASKWETIKGKYKPWKYHNKGLSQFTGAHPGLWTAIGIIGVLGGKAENSGIGKIFRFTPEIQLLRVKTNYYALDTNLDRVPDVRVKLGGKPRLVEFNIKMSGKEDKAALFFWVGGQQENLGGVSINMAPPSEKNAGMTAYFRGATSLEFEYGGKKITLIDENGTGKMGDIVEAVDAERYKPNVIYITDSMVLPGIKGLVPASTCIRLPDGFYMVQYSGYSITIRKLDMTKLKVGILRMDFKGPRSARPNHLIVKEITKFEGACFDIAQDPKGIEVPAGKYKIIGGALLKGGGARAKGYTICAIKKDTFEVKPGGVTNIKIGAPFKFKFSYLAMGSKIRIDGLSLRIVGAGGEVYVNPWEATPQPIVYARKGNSGKGKKVGKMKTIKNADELNKYVNSMRAKYERFDIRDAIFNPADLIVNKPFKGRIQVRLIEPRNKYFGKIMSDWK